ncbi:ArsR/SmtB family transcription factor [Halorarius halobius]|uniref:ArsR/SmtB family transcription factor n=1 Tax=Halorarius halobius TaxID=2962671 RepID=UPI0020CD723A|nr:metalloregulator ArsR/SmtB family transcription factor [Halorarius halobius]
MVKATDRMERLVTEEASCCGTTVEECERRLEEVAVDAGTRTEEADVDALSALANDTRYGIVRLLHAAGEELCVCELDAVTDVSDSAVSHALRTLREAGLVTARKEGRWKYYRTTDRATALLVALDGTRGPE